MGQGSTGRCPGALTAQAVLSGAVCTATYERSAGTGAQRARAPGGGSEAASTPRAPSRRPEVSGREAAVVPVAGVMCADSGSRVVCEDRHSPGDQAHLPTTCPRDPPQAASGPLRAASTRHAGGTLLAPPSLEGAPGTQEGPEPAPSTPTGRPGERLACGACGAWSEHAGLSGGTLGRWPRQTQSPPLGPPAFGGWGSVTGRAVPAGTLSWLPSGTGSPTRPGC